MRPQLDIGITQRHRDDGDVRAAFGVRLASEPFAEAAILTRAELHAVGIGVWPRGIGGRPLVGMIAELGRSLGEQLARVVRLQWRVRVLARTRVLEWIAAGLDMTLDVARLAGHPGCVFKFVVIRLDFRTRDAPVLQRHVIRDEALAVALLVFGTNT